ncbi:hypothetical protein [Bernardetia sp. MNP-M8]|uniref:hypothetical protein n=2 Tax=unclassified Bernardetia TaxID=2647129 RepID=UPI0030D3F9CE
MLSILNIKIVKRVYGKNHKAAVEMATPSFEQTITSSERPMSGVIIMMNLIILNLFLSLFSFEIGHMLLVLYILLVVPSYYFMKLYTKNNRHKRAIEKFNSYILIQKISLFIFSSILFWSLCGMTFYSIILI